MDSICDHVNLPLVKQGPKVPFALLSIIRTQAQTDHHSRLILAPLNSSETLSAPLPRSPSQDLWHFVWLLALFFPLNPRTSDNSVVECRREERDLCGDGESCD